METQDDGQEAVGRVRRVFMRARTGASDAIGRIPAIANMARCRAEQVAERLPGTVGRAQAGAESTVTRLQTMPDSRLGLLAAVSIGFGVGLRLAGAPRLATLAGFAPASILGFAIASRPGRTHTAPKSA